MGNRTSTLTLTTKGAAAKIALGAASLMVLTVIGSATLAGATPVTGNAEVEGTTSLTKHNEKNNDKNNQNQRDKEHHANQRDKEHHSNNGNHGYGGNENAVHSNVSINQSGHDNVLTVIFNYIFG